jgi:hypothetical protein
MAADAVTAVKLFAIRRMTSQIPHVCFLCPSGHGRNRCERQSQPKLRDKIHVSSPSKFKFETPEPQAAYILNNRNQNRP